MRKTFFVCALVAFAVAMVPRSAAAITVHCPVADVGTNDYFVSNAVDCVYDGAKDGQNNIGGQNDEFLAGEGINEADYGNTGPTFGKTWTIVCSTGGFGSCAGLTISGSTTSANYTVTDGAYASYALGIKDGDQPFWAVFLLDATKSGLASMTGGGFSHFVLYGSGTPTSTNTDVTPVPEPASLLLLSSGLAFAGNRLRKRRARATSAI